MWNKEPDSQNFLNKLELCVYHVFFLTLDLSFLYRISLSRILLWHLFDIYHR